MSDYKPQPIGSYEYLTSKKGTKMLKIKLDKNEFSKVADWDLDKIYIYNPSRQGGKLFGIIKNETDK